MVNNVAKILKGLNNVHFAKFNGEDYDVPVRIKYAKKLKIHLILKPRMIGQMMKLFVLKADFQGEKVR